MTIGIAKLCQRHTPVQQIQSQRYRPLVSSRRNITLSNNKPGWGWWLLLGKHCSGTSADGGAVDHDIIIFVHSVCSAAAGCCGAGPATAGAAGAAGPAGARHMCEACCRQEGQLL